jgi:hypothetical protein
MRDRATSPHENLRAPSHAVPSKYRAFYAKALAGDLSPRQAIKAKCQACCGWEDLKSRVGGCTVRACPLWPLRPYQDAPDTRQRGDREASANEVWGGGVSATDETGPCLNGSTHADGQ